MKKIFTKMFIALISIVMIFACNDVEAQGMSKKLQKKYDKMAKQQVKKYTREGWKVDGTTKSLEVALMEHYEKLKNDDNRELVGSVDNCNNRNVCQNQALNNAINKYAQEAKSFVKGRVESEISDLNDNEIDNFYSAYERLVASTIEGELKFSVALYKEDRDGNKTYDMFFIVNENRASKLRMKAMENAAKESEVAQKYAEQISKFVNEGFEEL